MKAGEAIKEILKRRSAELSLREGLGEMNLRIANILTPFRSLDAMRLEELYRDIYESGRFEASYLLMLVLSCLIALLGLLTNSPAVVIGAMLISPLMGPILACGLALTLGDWRLGKKALKNVLFSVAEAIGIAMLATWISPLKEATAEILARTHPNLMDLMIALFSGVAGTLALTKGKGGLTIIPGVAVATAVMPPLAVTGYGLGTAQWLVARGGFMLFFTNLMAIVISSDLVFLLVGFRPRHAELQQKHRLRARNRILVALAILIVLSIPLVQTLILAARQARFRQDISGIIKGRLEQSGKSTVVSLDFNAQTDPTPIEVVVRATELFDRNAVDELSRELSSKLGRAVRLDLRQVLVEEGGVTEAAEIARRRDALRGGTEAMRDFVQSEISKMPLSAFEQRIIEAVTRTSQDAFSLLPGVKLEETKVVLASSGQPLTVQYRLLSPEPLAPQSKAIMENFMTQKLGRPVRIELRSYLSDPRFSLAITFPAKRSAPSTKAVQSLRGFLRDLQSANFNFVIELTYKVSEGGPDQATLWQRRLVRIKNALVSSGKLDSSRIIERSVEASVNVTAGSDAGDGVTLQVVQIL